MKTSDLDMIISYIEDSQKKLTEIQDYTEKQKVSVENYNELISKLARLVYLEKDTRTIERLMNNLDYYENRDLCAKMARMGKSNIAEKLMKTKDNNGKYLILEELSPKTLRNYKEKTLDEKAAEIGFPPDKLGNGKKKNQKNPFYKPVVDSIRKIFSRKKEE